MKRSESARPGVLLYFDIWPSLSRLSYVEKGRMLEAIFEYAQYQVVPDFEDNLSLALVWDFLRPKLDRDGERYEHQVSQRQYARYCRSEKEQGRIPLDFESWASGDQVTAVTFRSTTTTSTPTTKTSSSTTAATDTTAAAATTNIYQLTTPQPESGLSPRQREAEFENLRRERMQAVAGWKGG